MESSRRRHRIHSIFHRHRAVQEGSADASEIAAEDLRFAEMPATQEQITQLLDSIESALAATDADGVRMSDDVKRYASHVEKHLDKVVAAVQISKDILDALGNLPWVGVGLTIVAMGLDVSLKAHDNKDQCRVLMRHYLDVWKRYMRPVLEMEGSHITETMVESLDIIVQGYLLLKDWSNKGLIGRFLHANNYSQEIQKLEKELGLFLLKEVVVNTAPSRILGCSAAPCTLPTEPVGLEGSKQHVVRLLKLEAREETRVVVLHGMGGVGKSLLSMAVYNEACAKANSRARRHCQIEMGENPTKEHIRNMQIRMVRCLTGQLLDKDSSELVEDKLRQVLLSEAGAPVMIYIDNVLRHKDLEDLLPLDYERIRLPKGSRWLVTTRDEAVCTDIFSRIPGFEVEEFKVKVLTDKDARKLFCLHAFGLEEPSLEVMRVYNDGRGMIDEMVTSVCGNLPLALKLLGRSLYKKNVQVWTTKYDSLKKDPCELERLSANVVKSSYDTLDEETQTTFLMACVCFQNFCNDIFKDVVKSILPRATTSRLFELGLLDLGIDQDNEIVVRIHDVVRALGHQMAVVKKYAPPITPTCVQDLDGNDEMWSGVKWLRVPAMEGGIDARFIERCRELEVIVLEVAVNGQIANPPLPLKAIIHYESSSSVMPWRFGMLKKLAYFLSALIFERKLLYSVMPWRFEKLKELAYLALSTPIRDFSVVAPSAGRLRIFRSFGGSQIPPEAIDLHSSTLLALCCEETAQLSSYFCQKMTKLQELALHNFHGKRCPEDMGHLVSLRRLVITSSSVQELPQSLGHLGRLQKLHLCLTKLRDFPPGVIKGLSELVYLGLDLHSVTSFPIQDLEQLASLEVLVLSLPAMDRFVDLQEDRPVCVELGQLKQFHLWCESMSNVEGVRLTCPSLESLALYLGEVETLPPGFINCSTKFQALALIACFSLGELSRETEILLHARTWYLEDCADLRAIPDGMMDAVESLVVLRCPGMQRLPADIDEHKARSMRFLACDAQILPPDFTAFPTVLSISAGEDDTPAKVEVDLFFKETFFPPSIIGL